MKTKFGVVGLVYAITLTALADEPPASEVTGIDVATIEYERQAQAETAEQRQLETRQAFARAAAHARMPSTMHASTPSDPNKVPHVMPGPASQPGSIVDLVMPRYLESVTEAASKPFSQRVARVLRSALLVEQSRDRRDVSRQRLRLQHPVAVGGSSTVSGRSSAFDQLVIPYFPAASDSSGRQGIVRLINRSTHAGEVTIQAIDEAGSLAEPIRFTMDAGSVRHVSSLDLEQGSAVIGRNAGTGPGQGAWVLALSSTVAIDVLAYIQTSDGFLTSIHDAAPKIDHDSMVAYLSSSDDANSEDFLRLVNLTAEPARVVIFRFDELGSTRSSVTVELPARHARTYSADELTAGVAPGLSGFLGEVNGDRYLSIETPPDVLAMSFSLSTAGHLANLSNFRSKLGTRGAPLFLSASDQQGRQSVLRVRNRDSRPVTVNIQGFDDHGRAYEVLTLSLDANGTALIDSHDLELGNTAKGLTGRTGSGEGDWRLEFSSESDIEVLAFVRTSDGLMTPMQDTVAMTENRHDIALFKAVDDSRQVGLLRLINVGTDPADVTIQGTDDRGVRHGRVRLTVGAGVSRTLSAGELEMGGEKLQGMLGNGDGEWRLAISSGEPIQVMNLLSTPTRHLTNLSTAASLAANEEETAESVFETLISPIVQSQCINCHVRGGASQNTRLVFVGDDDEEHLTKNLGAFQALLDEVEDGADYILNKIQGVGHGGGVQVRSGTDGYTAMARFLELLGEEVDERPSITVETLFDGVTLESYRQTLRRAAIVFAGRVPTDAEYAKLIVDDEASLRAAIRGLMQGPGFHEFLIRASNDRLLTDRDSRVIDAAAQNDFVAFANLYHELATSGLSSGELYRWSERAQYGFRRAPLELIAYVAENDLPYTDILTANYIMANPLAAEAYGASTTFNNPDDVHEFQPSQIVSYYRDNDTKVSTYSLAEGTHVSNPGELATDYPHAGILNTTVFLSRYPTTATNRNRARSRWTYYHFLGVDIEKSASRTTDPVALADTNNPTMHNPACTVCHDVLDPVAGTFQNYGDAGFYRDQWGGMDSLDDQYKSNERNAEFKSVNARTWEERETLVVKAWLSEGSHTVGLATRSSHNIHVDYLEIRNGGVVISRHELEESDNQDCGRAWIGRTYELIHCPLVVDINVPTDGVYVVEIAAYVGHDYDEVPGRAANLAIWVPYDENYQLGDTWYRDMRVPAFGEDLAPDAEKSAQWLSERIVADTRFAEATVKFWWPSIMGSEVLEPPEDADDAGYESALLASNAQTSEVQRLANAFRVGVGEGEPFNLKDLLVEITLIPWFRAASIESDESVRSSALRQAGARHLLTPEELATKTRHLAGFQWGRQRDQSWRRPHEESLSSLTDPERGYGLLYGGIDSDGITDRAREMTSVMSGVAQSHASESSCPIVMRELFLLDEEERLLFNGFDREITPKWEFGETFTIDAASWTDRETLTQTGFLSTGRNEVAMTFTNDHRDDDGDRDVRLYELKVRDEHDRVVHEASLRDLEPPIASWGACGFAHAWNDQTRERDHFKLIGTCRPGTAEFMIETDGVYSVEVVVWADQYGDELAQLEIVVQSNTESSAGAASIREQLVLLYDRLHGLDVGMDSAEVQSAYEFFVETWEANLDDERASTDFRHWGDIECDWARDQYFLDGILDDAWTYLEEETEHGWDWEGINSYFESVDFSDPQGVARTWVVVMAYLLMDYRYLYL